MTDRVMEPIGRRTFIGRVAMFAPLLALRPDLVASATIGAAIAKRRPSPLPNVTTGSLLTADSWNALVDRVNELGQR